MKIIQQKNRIALRLNEYQRFIILLVSQFSILLFLSSAAFGEEKTAGDAYSNMPVKEVTVFKDGHVFVLHEGSMQTDKNGNVELDYLPRPVIGTFWTYSNDKNAGLNSVVSGRRIITVKKTALEIREMLEANEGAKVRIREDDKTNVYEAMIYQVPKRTSEELERTSTPGEDQKLSQRGGIVLLKVAEGIKAVEFGKIKEVTFIDDYRSIVPQEEFRNLMTLKLDWRNGKVSDKADIGMMYVQRGIRWIPNYRVEIDGKGNAMLKLQATLVNELADIKDVKAHLVIGVPSFAFKDTVDPISLQQTVARLSSHFQEDSRTAMAFSNAIMSQSASAGRSRRMESEEAEAIDLGPEVTGSSKNEDLYVFTLEHVTLKKGQRMVVPVTEFKLKYKDVYSLDLPFGPPPEVRQRFSTEQEIQIAKLYGAPRVKHLIRLTNDSRYPLTTSPAMIFSNGKILAQGMMTYTAVGADGDLELTTAVDIAVQHSDKEVERIPNAENWNGNVYSRSNMTGSIKLTNRRSNTVYVEIERSILGHIDKADNDGKVEQLGWYENGLFASGNIPPWWYWHRWDFWWYHFNSIGKVKWDLEIKSGKSAELTYDWHYFWRW